MLTKYIVMPGDRKQFGKFFLKQDQKALYLIFSLPLNPCHSCSFMCFHLSCWLPGPYPPNEMSPALGLASGTSCLRSCPAPKTS